MRNYNDHLADEYSYDTDSSFDDETPEETGRLARIRGNLGKAAIGIAGMTLAIGIMNNVTPSQNEHPEQFSQNFNDEATSVLIENDDAPVNVRHDPVKPSSVDGDNTALQIEDKKIDLSVEGVYVFKDNNGTWYGVPAKSLGIEGDKDGLVWINEQSASIKTSDSATSISISK